MILYKLIDQFDRSSGKKIKSQLIFDKYICDFTGKELDEYQNPNIYIIDYNDNDPNFGCGVGEYELSEKYNVDPYSIFASNFVFYRKIEGGGDVFVDMIELAQKELDEIYGLDHILRWSRIRMLTKVLEEGKYTLEELGLEQNF